MLDYTLACFSHGWHIIQLHIIQLKVFFIHHCTKKKYYYHNYYDYYFTTHCSVPYNTA